MSGGEHFKYLLYGTIAVVVVMIVVGMVVVVGTAKLE